MCHNVLFRHPYVLCISLPLRDERIRAVVATGLTQLTAAVDGADQQAYEI